MLSPAASLHLDAAPGKGMEKEGARRQAASGLSEGMFSDTDIKCSCLN